MSQLTYSSSENNNNWCLLCRLCNNNNPNPWHTTATCPLKDPTFIQQEGIHENVLQHNSLYGKLNKNYIKKRIYSLTTTTPYQPSYQQLTMPSCMNTPAVILFLPLAHLINSSLLLMLSHIYLLA